MACAGPRPPTRWSLRLTIRPAPRRMASAVRSRLVGRLVQADRRGDRLLERGQAVEVVRGHRLLEHQQVVLVELAEDVDVGGGVGPVGVDHERDVAEVLADGADELEILSGLDLDLHPAVAGLQMGLDRLDQLDDAGIEPDRQARLDAHGRSAGRRRPAARRSRHGGPGPAGPTGPSRRRPRRTGSPPSRRRSRRCPRRRRTSGRAGRARSSRPGRPSIPPACRANSRSSRPSASSRRARRPRPSRPRRGWRP